jgi:hypothetical protein
MRTWWLALALVGCESATVPDDAGVDAGIEPSCVPDLTPEPRSGARLKLTWFVYEDGTRQWNADAAFFDAARRETCKPQKWADGNVYCTPPEWMSLQYADADCSQPVGVDTGLSDRPAAYAADYTMQCGELLLTRLFEVGPATGAGQFYSKHGETCSPGQAGFPLHAVGGEVTPRDLVKLTTRSIPGSSSLHLLLQQGDDCTSVPLGIESDELKAQCNVYAPPNASIAQCSLGAGSPNAGVDVNYFSDASCKTAVPPVFDSGCVERQASILATANGNPPPTPPAASRRRRARQLKAALGPASPAEMKTSLH